MRSSETQFSISDTLASISFLLVAAGILAASAPDKASPVDLIKSRNQSVENILEASGDSVDAVTKEKLKDVINGLMDFRELSRRALGKYWDQRSEQERNDFVDVFRQLIRNSSVKKLSIYKADSMVYQPPAIKAEQAEVTTIAYKGKKKVEIAYKMHRIGSEWKMYDMVIDGVSTARNYRESFYKEIAKTSYEEMYNKLVSRLKEQEG